MTAPSIALPSGAKLWLLNLGHLDIDSAVVLSGANIFAAHQPPQQHERRDLIMIAALLYHPDVGLILFDAGSGEDAIKSWGREALEYTPRTWTKQMHGLPEAIRATGAGEISDIKAIVMSHLHQDHAGGLEHFLDSDATVTGIEKGTYQPDYLVVDRLNWKTFSGATCELFQGVTLHHCSGHTPGGVVMEIQLNHTGTVVLTGDAFHVAENYELGIPPGAITRDFNAWHRSRQYIRNLVQSKKAKVVLGHEPAYFKALKADQTCIE
ncbi:beta-lactamase-like protein [Aspergillus crustosus]